MSKKKHNRTRPLRYRPLIRISVAPTLVVLTIAFALAARPTAGQEVPAPDPNSMSQRPGAQRPATAVPASTQPVSRPVARAPRKLSEAELDRLLTELAETFGRVQTLHAEFRQQKHLSILAEPMVSHGRILFARPRSFRLQYEAPFASVTMTRGDRVHCLEKMPDGWREIDVPGSMVQRVTGQIPYWIRGQFDREDAVFRIDAAQDDGYTLRLTPRSEEFRRHIGHIELRIPATKDRISEVAIYEDQEDYTRILLGRQARNTPLDEALFVPRADGPAPAPELPSPATTNPAMSADRQPAASGDSRGDEAGGPSR